MAGSGKAIDRCNAKPNEQQESLSSHCGNKEDETILPLWQNMFTIFTKGNGKQNGEMPLYAKCCSFIPQVFVLLAIVFKQYTNLITQKEKMRITSATKIGPILDNMSKCECSNSASKVRWILKVGSKICQQPAFSVPWAQRTNKEATPSTRSSVFRWRTTT